MNHVKNILLVFAICLVSTISIAQKDSLTREARTLDDGDTNKVLALLELTRYVYQYNHDSAIHLCKQVQELSENIDYKNGLGNAYGWLGYLYQITGNYTEAIESNISSIDLWRRMNSEEGVLISYINLAALYSSVGEMVESKKANYLAKDLAVKIKDSLNLAYIYLNLAEEVGSSSKFDTNLIYIDSSVYFAEAVGNLEIIAMSNMKRGEVVLNAGYADSATVLFNKSLAAIKDYPDKSLAAKVLSGLAVIHMKTNPDRAIYFGKEALDTARTQPELATLNNIHNSLAVAYQIKGNYEKSAFHYQKFVKLSEELNKEASQKEIVGAKFKIAYQQKQYNDSIQIAIRETEVARDKAHAEEVQSVTNWVIGLVILVAIALGFAFVSKRKSAKDLASKNDTIMEQKLKVEEKNKEITDSINYAKRLQDAILPPNSEVLQLLPTSFIYYLPKDIVAGDFYWVEESNSKVYFAVADCTGHGVPGAMVSVVCSNALSRSLHEFELKTPAAILDKTREIVINNFKKGDNVQDGMDIALCALDTNTGDLEYAGANNPLVVIRASGELEETKGDKQPVANYDKLRPFTNHKEKLSKGDSVYLYSDGYIDQFGGEKGKKFKSANLKKLLAKLNAKEFSKIHDELHDHFIEWSKDVEQLDDVCIMGAKFQA